MFLRALLLLLVVAAASIALTYYLGAEVVLALGLILSQLKLILVKIASIKTPAILAWLKAQAADFARIELLKKWFMTTLLPLLVGNAIIRQIERVIRGYLADIRRRYDAMIAWYRGLRWYEQLVAALIVLFLTLALTVSSLGLWLVLFSVQLPFWAIAAVTAFGRMVWLSIQKTAFKTIAFLQLTWGWRFLRRRLPSAYLERKRRFDFRVARMVVRKRRLTVRQLSEQKESLSMRWALFWAWLRSRPIEVDPAPPQEPTENEG